VVGKAKFSFPRTNLDSSFALISASIIGLIDDIFVVHGKGKYIGGGLKFKTRFILVCLIGLIGGAWFYFKLGWSSIHIPLLFNFPSGIDINLGWSYILLFVIVCCFLGKRSG